MSKLDLFEKSIRRILVLAMSLALLACGGGGGGGGNTGTLNLSLTDAPACGYDHVYVSVEKISVHASANASESDAGWNDLIINPVRRIDLLTLRNGILDNLGQLALSAGHYSQLRLVLATNAASAPYANAVVPTGSDGTELALTTPSAQQSGIKLNADITIAANEMADFVLDFDACKSVVAAGKAGKYLLKPVIAVIPNYLSGVLGHVETALANGNTQVTIQQGGVVIKATSPDNGGRFLLQPMAPAASYDVVITAPGKVTTVITGVPVTSGQVLSLNSSTTPFELEDATAGQAKGTVTITPSVELIDASVIATQTLNSGKIIEIAQAAANAGDGNYALTLPAAAPWTASYVAPPGAYSFAPDATAGTKYTLTARAGDASRQEPIEMSADGDVVTNFRF